MAPAFLRSARDSRRTADERQIGSQSHWAARETGLGNLSPAQMAVVCFRFGREEAHQGRIVDAMLRDGYAFLTSTKIKGAACLRLCTINPRTTEAEMIETVDRLDECARKCL